MREIKFRAWDKAEHDIYKRDESVNRMTYYTNPFINDDGFMQLECIGQSAIGDHDQNRFVIMQYTGLKDKNGKEIYEGDIVRYRYPKEEDDYGDPVLVQWSTDLGGFELVDPKDKWFDGLFYGNPEYEVIGNIYENPELIKNSLKGEK